MGALPALPEYGYICQWCCAYSLKRCRVAPLGLSLDIFFCHRVASIKLNSGPATLSRTGRYSCVQCYAKGSVHPQHYLVIIGIISGLLKSILLCHSFDTLHHGSYGEFTIYRQKKCLPHTSA